MKRKIKQLLSEHPAMLSILPIIAIVALFIVFQYISLTKLLTLTRENNPKALIGTMRNPVDNFTTLLAIVAILQLILAFSISTSLISAHLLYKLFKPSLCKFLKTKKDIILKLSHFPIFYRKFCPKTEESIIFKDKQIVNALKFIIPLLIFISLILTYIIHNPLLLISIAVLLGLSLITVLIIKNKEQKQKEIHSLLVQKPLPNVSFSLRTLALTALLYLVMLLLTYTKLSVNVVNAYNPVALQAKDKYPFQSYEVSASEAYEYLSKIKHDFKIRDQEVARTAFQKRLKSGKKPIIYVIDSFHGANPTVAYIYGIIPIPTITYHGDIVEKIIESILHDELEKDLVTIKKINFPNLTSETKNAYLLDPFKDPLVEILTRIEKENPNTPVFINMSFGRNYFSPVADQRIEKFIELNNKGIILVKSAGNKEEHTITSLGVTEALGFLLENLYTVGDAKRFQPGEVNIDGIAKVIFDNGAKTTLKGTSFSSPAYLALFVKKLFFTGYLSENGNGQHLRNPQDSSTKPQ